jgi:hypothetical protein
MVVGKYMVWHGPVCALLLMPWSTPDSTMCSPIATTIPTAGAYNWHSTVRDLDTDSLEVFVALTVASVTGINQLTPLLDPSRAL